jgi:hypothetical protein
MTQRIKPNSPHAFKSLSRRNFLSGISKTALAIALTGAWRLPAMATSQAGGASYALSPLAPLGGVLQTPSPKLSPINRWGYRWVFNHVTRAGRGSSINDIGTLQIHRKVTGDKVEYQVEQERRFADYNATLVSDNKSGEPLNEWRCQQITLRRGAEPLISEVEGRVAGAEVEITRGQIHEKISLSGPLHSEIALLVNPANLEALAGRGITLLEGGAMLRPDVLVSRDPAADATVDGVSAAAWLMTGTGLLPAHFMVDAEGRGLCRTLFTTSIVLQETSV